VTGEILEMPLTEQVGKAGIGGEILLRKPGDLPTLLLLRPADGVFRDGERTVDLVRTPHRLPPRIQGRAMAVTLHVCITCRAGQTIPEGEPTPGSRLHKAVVDLGAPEGVNIVPVECLSACNNGCSVALSAPGRWAYVYGRLSETNARDVLAGAAAYAAAPDGIVPWRTRPEIFRKQSLARIPPINVLPEAAE
jgi:predicted metal-binding protein